MLNLIITVALVVLCIIITNRGLNPTIVFLGMGLLAAAVVTIMTGATVANAPGSGNLIIDVFEAAKDNFLSTFQTVGMAILPIYGYSVYMNHIKASSVLGSVIANPISKSKNPYIVGVFVTILVCGLMRIAIVSAVAIMALFITTLYPALLKSGLSRTSAMAAIFLGTCFDWGPADFVIIQLTAGVEGFDMVDYFINGSLRVVPFVLLIVAATAGIIFQMIDKKQGYVLGSHIPEDLKIEKVDLPLFYAVLPLLPLIFILIFSPLFPTNIAISVVSAVIISLILVLIIETIRKGDFKARFNEINTWVKGMGEGFGSLLVMVITLMFFVNMVMKLNGFSVLVDFAIGSGMSPWLLLIVFAALVAIATLLVGNGRLVGIMLCPLAIPIAAGLGIPFYAALMPIQIVQGMRIFNLGTGIWTQYACTEASTTPMELLKRAALPCLIMYIATFVLAPIIL